MAFVESRSGQPLTVQVDPLARFREHRGWKVDGDGTKHPLPQSSIDPVAVVEAGKSEIVIGCDTRLEARQAEHEGLVTAQLHTP